MKDYPYYGKVEIWVWIMHLKRLKINTIIIPYGHGAFLVAVRFLYQFEIERIIIIKYAHRTVLKRSYLFALK